MTTRSQSIGHFLILTMPPKPSVRLTSSATAARWSSETPSPVFEPTELRASNILFCISPDSFIRFISHSDFSSLNFHKMCVQSPESPPSFDCRKVASFAGIRPSCKAGELPSFSSRFAILG